MHDKICLLLVKFIPDYRSVSCTSFSMGFDAQTAGNHVGVPFYGQSMPQFIGSMPQFDGSMPQFMLGSPFPIPPANDKGQATHAQAMPQLNGSFFVKPF